MGYGRGGLLTPHYEPGGHEGFMGRDIGQSCEKRKIISRRDASRHSRYPKQGPGPKMAKVITEVVCLFRNRKGRKTVALFSDRSGLKPTGCRALKQGHEAGNGESHYGRGVSSWQKRSVKRAGNPLLRFGLRFGLRLEWGRWPFCRRCDPGDLGGDGGGSVPCGCWPVGSSGH